MSDFSSGDVNDPQALSGHAGEHGHAKIDPVIPSPSLLNLVRSEEHGL